SEPRKLLRRNKRQALVVRLEDDASLVQPVAPGRVVLGDPRVEHEVVCPPGDGDGIELDRSEAAEDLENALWARLYRAPWREQLPRHEEAPRRLGGHLERAFGFCGRTHGGVGTATLACVVTGRALGIGRH